MERPDEIRQTAIGLFAKQGYRGTSMKDIAEELNIRAPSLYKHVDSKQELLRDVMESIMQRLVDDFQVAVADASDPVDAVRRATVAHVLHHARFPDETRIGNREIPSLEEPARSRLLALRRRYTNAWEDLIRQGVDAGVFAVPSPRLAVFAILEMGIGVANWYRPTGHLADEEIADYFATLALRIAGWTGDTSPVNSDG